MTALNTEPFPTDFKWRRTWYDTDNIRHCTHECLLCGRLIDSPISFTPYILSEHRQICAPVAC